MFKEASLREDKEISAGKQKAKLRRMMTHKEGVKIEGRVDQDAAAAAASMKKNYLVGGGDDDSDEDK